MNLEQPLVELLNDYKPRHVFNLHIHCGSKLSRKKTAL